MPKGLVPKGGKHVGKIASKGSTSLSRSSIPGPSSSKMTDVTPSVASVLDELTSLVKQTQVRSKPSHLLSLSAG